MNLYEVCNSTQLHHVVASTEQEATDIAKFAFKMRTTSKHFHVGRVYTLYLMEGRSVPTADILDGIGVGTGYIDGSGTAVQQYANGFEWYPFTPFNIRQHFVDLALAAL